MLGAFTAAFRTPDLRKKILFTLSLIALYRLGTSIPSPGVSLKNVNDCINIVNQGSSRSFYSLVNLFSGGALLKLSIFALGIMPYITASIIIQLLTVVIPRFEQYKKEGQAGQAKLTQYTRYLTIGLGVTQATGLVAIAKSGTLFQGCPNPVLANESIFALSTMVMTMVAGTAVIMWLGELITDRGVGNGMSVLIFTSIAARIPAEGQTVLQHSNKFVFFLVILLVVAIIAAVVFIEQGQRRIPVQYAKRMVGRREYGGTSTYLPLKVNMAGVIPVIFASSLLYVPSLATQFRSDSTSSWQRFISQYLINQTSWVYNLIFFTLIVFFTYFYAFAVAFDPKERAEDMKKFGGFIPGIRPGIATQNYLSYVLNRLTFPGAIYLGIVAILPTLFIGLTGPQNNQNFPFGGTAVLIIVGVGLDTVKQIESQLIQRNYEGFLR